MNKDHIILIVLFVIAGIGISFLINIEKTGMWGASYPSTSDEYPVNYQDYSPYFYFYQKYPIYDQSIPTNYGYPFTYEEYPVKEVKYVYPIRNSKYPNLLGAEHYYYLEPRTRYANKEDKKEEFFYLPESLPRQFTRYPNPDNSITYSDRYMKGYRDVQPQLQSMPMCYEEDEGDDPLTASVTQITDSTYGRYETRPDTCIEQNEAIQQSKKLREYFCEGDQILFHDYDCRTFGETSYCTTKPTGTSQCIS